PPKPCRSLSGAKSSSPRHYCSEAKRRQTHAGAGESTTLDIGHPWLILRRKFVNCCSQETTPMEKLIDQKTFEARAARLRLHGPTREALAAVVVGGKKVADAAEQFGVTRQAIYR